MQSSAVIQWRRWQVLLVLFLLCVLMYIIFSNMSLPRNLVLFTATWKPYTHSTALSKEWFEKTCVVGAVPVALEHLPATIADWRRTKHDKCRDLYLMFIKMFKVKADNGTVVLPKPFQTKVRGWLGNKEELFQEIYNQKVIVIRNLYTREENTFNPLRSKRPLSAPAVPEKQYIDNLSSNTEPSCDFCKHRDYTAYDPLGRIENKYSFSAANTFKLDRWHALLLLRSHHPLNWNLEKFLDLMNTTSQWFRRVYQHSPDYRYPSGIMDLLPHAGASQIHPHIHGFMNKDSYPGTVEQWRRAALDYSADFPTRNYFSDLIEIHSILGLTVTYGSAVAVANIVPKKDNEILIVSEKPDEDFYHLWYFVIRAYLDDMTGGTYCYSSGIAFPSMSGEINGSSLPAYVRIVTRGVVSDVRSDISSLELFGSPNANTDPYTVIAAIRESVRKRGAPQR